MHKLETYLQQTFGFSQFRSHQREIIESILQGKDLLAILPTGGGKSLCYQLPALDLPGMTLVLSPLVSLMKDQVDSLIIKGIRADWINSTLTPKQMKEKMLQVASGNLQLLYLAPERLKSEDFIDLLQTIHVSLVAVDEAHCISSWGHDFRPSYKKIGTLLKNLPYRPPIAAFTATATLEVKEDIIEKLGLIRPAVFQDSFDRPNLYFTVESPDDKKKWLQTHVDAIESPAIFYAATRKECETTSNWLKDKGKRVVTYHAGLSKKERQEAQEAFLLLDDIILVATNAFGMGIDKPNIRTILHLQMPKDIESYYQEAGRGGRDNQTCRCILLFGAGDAHLHRQMILSRPAYYGGRDHSFKKLQQMLGYVFSDACYRKYLLTYFGDTTAQEHCDFCGHCTNPILLSNVTKEAQILLSTLHYLKAKQGISVISGIVRGSKQKKIQQQGWDKLSTYHLLPSWSDADIRRLWLYLHFKGYLHKSDRAYARTYITRTGIDLLKGMHTVTLINHKDQL